MRHFRIQAESREEIERRVLLVFALNQAESLTPGELLMATGISTRPVDQTPGLEAAIAHLVELRVLAVSPGATRSAVTVLDDDALPHQAAEALRAEMGLEEPEDGQPLRLMALPGPQLSDRLPIGAFAPVSRGALRLVVDRGAPRSSSVAY